MHAQWVVCNASVWGSWTSLLRSSLLALSTCVGKQHLHKSFSINFLISNVLLVFLQYSYYPNNYSFATWVDPPAIHPYEVYITYLEGRIDKLQHELAEALTPPNPPSSDDTLCTCKCYRKNTPPSSPSPPASPPPPPPFVYYYMPSQESTAFGSMLSEQFS
jgi:hypothetical protein